MAAGLNIRPRRGVLATFTTSFSRVELPEGNFSTKILRAVINTQLNPFISFSNNVQFDSVSQVLGWQFRFRWILRPGNDIYVVWLNNWLDSAQGLMTTDRSGSLEDCLYPSVLVLPLKGTADVGGHSRRYSGKLVPVLQPDITIGHVSRASARVHFLEQSVHS